MPLDDIDMLLRVVVFARKMRLMFRPDGSAMSNSHCPASSSLLYDRAIVSPIPGTTRDTIEETANIRGLPVVFIDTAGLREARDEIEQEGVRRSHESLAKAEFILHVLDASEPLTAADKKYLGEFAGKKRILVVNKMDLPRKLKFE